MAQKLIELSGQKFGRLTVKSYAGKYRWHCVCECGTEKTVRSSNLKSGNVRSCGCLSIERTKETNTRHGGFGTPEYSVWNAMIHRCTHETCDKWEFYGGRGIDVCARWRHGEDGLHGFECFLTDMGRRPTPKHTLDRSDNERDYSAANCKWVTHKENCKNRRSNVKITFNGQQMLLFDAFVASGELRGRQDSLNATYYRRRKAGMTPQEAFDSAIARKRLTRKTPAQSIG